MTHSPEDLKRAFWNELRADRIVMLGMPGKANARPMTAMILGEEDRGPVWFFTSSATEMGRMHGPAHGEFDFVSKGHGLFANVQGTISPDSSPTRIDALWNPMVEAWFEGGRQDPTLRLMRFDCDEAEIWLSPNSLVAGVKLYFGIGDPRADYADNNAKVALG